MTKQEIVERLRSLLPKGKYWPEQDFGYDVKIISEQYAEEEPFMWLCYEEGTALVSMDVNKSIAKHEKDESMRLFALRNGGVSNILDTYEDRRGAFCVHYDGCNLYELSAKDGVALFNKTMHPVLEWLRRAYQAEYAVCDAPLKIEFTSTEAQDSYEDELKRAEDMNDSSLKNIFERMRGWCRQSIDHVVYVSRDICAHSFYFEERIRGRRAFNGGIIYSEESYNGSHWNMHT